MVKKLPFCKMKNLECFTMTAGFGNSAKFEDPNLERQADDRLAPFNEITRETVEWTKGTIAGRNQPYDKWIKQLKQFDKTSKCGRVWGSDYIAYRLVKHIGSYYRFNQRLRCRTCAFNSCMSLCAECFEAGNHDGHDFNMFHSGAGGACDCGDSSVMDEKGICIHHQGWDPLTVRDHIDSILFVDLK